MPITPEDKKWIETNMLWLFEQFGHAPFMRNELVKVAHEYFPFKLKEDDTRPLEVLIEKMCQDMDIPVEKVRFDIFFSDNQNGGTYALGYYLKDFDLISGESFYQILLNLSPLSNKAGILATLSHELAHIKLLGENRVLASEEDHEHLTDLCTLFWGYGLIGANQAFSSETDYHPDAPGFSYSAIRRSGYLPLEMWAYALALYCSLKDIHPEEVRPFLSKEMQIQFAQNVQILAEQPLAAAWSHLNRQGISPDPLERNLLQEADKLQFQLLDQAIHNNAFPQAWLDRARLNREHGLLGPALQDVHQLMQRGQLRDEALLERAQIALDLGKADQVIEDLELMSPKARQWPESLYMAAFYHWHIQDMESAENYLRQVLASRPTHPKANWSMAVIFFWKKDFKSAHAHFQIAIQHNPRNPLFWIDRAKLYMLEGNLKRASEDLHTALGMNTALAEAYVGRGILRRKEKRYEAALQDFDTALGLWYSYEDAEWHKRVTEQLMTEELWIAVGNFETLEEAYPIRQQMQELGIKHRFRDQEVVNLTASTYISKWLYVRDEYVEEAMDVLTNGWW